MNALGRLSWVRHAAVAVTVVVVAAAGLFGFVGENHPERFDAKQITVARQGDNSLAVREVVDQDFGTHDRHGYERVIPNDFGIPAVTEVSSPDAPDDVQVEQVPQGTRIRIGDPNVTVSGQHRYVLSYVYPDAHLSSGELALDIIGTDDTLETGRMEIVVTGLELEDPQCNVGAAGTSGGCELIRDGDVYWAAISPLQPGQGVTIGGRIVGTTDVRDVPVPALPDRRDEPNRLPLAAGMLAVGTAAAVGVYAWSRRRGRNEVYAGGAADAAYGDEGGRRPGAPLPPPGTITAPVPAAASVRLVADDDLAALATTEFVPPKGVEPWQGAVALRERIDDQTVGAWFSGLAARGVLDLTKNEEDEVILRRGPRAGAASPEDLSRVDQLFGGSDEVQLGTYDPEFARVWRDVKAMQEREIAASGWWKRLPPSAGGCSGLRAAPFLVFGLVWIVVWAGTGVLHVAGLFSSSLLAILLAIAVPAITAYLTYRVMLPARSAAGSAVALRSESFRRFLAASEGRHVEWAWEHGLLREYSAWAVALGAAGAWKRALAESSVPPAEYVNGPILVYSMGSSFGRSYTQPSSSGGGSGGFGGFSGGSVGGGGGGGSSGSW
jgi:hypothetical protein